MHRLWLLIVLMAALLAGGCRPQPGTGGPSELWFRWQFAGTAALGTDTNATTLRAIAELPATQELHDAAARRLLVSLQKFLQPDTNFVSTNATELLRPLLDRAVQRGFVFENHGAAGKPTAWLLAVLLQGDEARQWETNFLAVTKELNLGAPKKLSTKSFGGWNITRPDKRYIDYLELSKWVVVGVGTDREPMIKALHKIESVVWPTPAPTNVWLAAEMDASHAGALAGITNTTGWPGLEFTVAGRSGNPFIEGRLRYAAPLGLKLPVWNVPTNLVRDPLISFTAARGLGPWLRGQADFQTLALTNAPDQFFLWAQSRIPFQTFAAAPLAGAGAAMENIKHHLPATWSEPLKNLASGLDWNSNHTELVWGRLPIIQPKLRVATEPNGEFLYGGLFPERPRSEPMPPALRAQLERTNLVYYDWEITQERLLQWRQLKQIWQMITLKPSASRAPATLAWIDAAAALLGNSVTEISFKNEHELTFVRKSSLGLTGFELVTLAQKLDAFIAPPDVRRRSVTPPPPPGF